MRESDIVKSITDLLDILMAQGKVYYVRLINPGIITHEQPPRKGQPDLVGWIQRRELRHNGTDYEFVMAPYPWAWEVKGSRGIVSDDQTADLEMAGAAGGQTRILWSLEDAVSALSELGVDVEIASG